MIEVFFYKRVCWMVDHLVRPIFTLFLTPEGWEAFEISTVRRWSMRIVRTRKIKYYWRRR